MYFFQSCDIHLFSVLSMCVLKFPFSFGTHVNGNPLLKACPSIPRTFHSSPHLSNVFLAEITGCKSVFISPGEYISHFISCVLYELSNTTASRVPRALLRVAWSPIRAEIMAKNSSAALHLLSKSIYGALQTLRNPPLFRIQSSLLLTPYVQCSKWHHIMRGLTSVSIMTWSKIEHQCNDTFWTRSLIWMSTLKKESPDSGKKYSGMVLEP